MGQTMSVRRRAINTRLGHDLQAEHAAHNTTLALLEGARAQLARALDERDDAREHLDKCRERLRLLVQELGAQFTHPPQALSRHSNLFRMLEEIAPWAIPPEPTDALSEMLRFAGISASDLSSYARAVTDGLKDDEGEP